MVLPRTRRRTVRCIAARQVAIGVVTVAMAKPAVFTHRFPARGGDGEAVRHDADGGPLCKPKFAHFDDL
jgi:hypothetical protein